MLPKLEWPTYDVDIPSTKEVVKMRPMLVKEEKLLLMAREGEDQNEIIRAMKQVVANCTLDKINSNLSLFDLEYLFLKLRSVSVSDNVKLAFKDNEDGKTREFDVDLKDVKMVFPEGVENNIKITDKIGMVLRYPAVSLYDDRDFVNAKGQDQTDRLVMSCIEKIYDGKNIEEVNGKYSPQLKTWLESLDLKAYEKINKFLGNLPHLEYQIKYTNDNGTERTVNLTRLTDFFTL